VCANEESCCRSNLVPGGTFKRDFDDSEHFPNPGFPAAISSFLLDKFEVTVGRFREFVDAYQQLDLQEGQGKAPHIASDGGWDSEAKLPADKQKLIELLESCEGHTWPAVSIDEQQRPINCVSFNVAYAFCVWDGGRLPTEGEWNYAAAGGDQQRTRPWLAPLEGPDISPDYAYYFADGNLLPTTVGKTPLGNGRWGQADLAGNVSEWVLDYYAEYSSELCVDCLNHTASDLRLSRGGSFQTAADFLVVPVREQWDPDAIFPNIGFRCARDVK
jgi:formylglycine-generating enzyme required for sulfatase activity